MPQFDISTFSAQLLWLGIVFGVLYLVISKIVAPKAEQILQNRGQFLAESVAMADAYMARVQKLRSKKSTNLQELNVAIEAFTKEANNNLNVQFLQEENNLSQFLIEKTNQSIADTELYIEDFKTKQPQFIINLAAYIVEKVTGHYADVSLLEKIYRKK